MTTPQQPPRRSPLAFLPLAVAALIAVAAAAVLMQGHQRAYVTNDVAGRPLPAFALPSLNGQEQVTPAAFAGKPFLINAFASWCVPCRAEHPVLLELAGQGVTIVGIAYKDDPAATERFLSELGNPYAAVAVDRAGAYALDLGTSGVPETFVVGADGRLLAVQRQPLTAESVRDVILPALRAGAAPAGP